MTSFTFNAIAMRWLASRGPRLACGRLLCALALMPAGVVAVQAQDGPGVPGPAVFYTSIQPLSATISRYGRDPRPQTTEGAFQLADWLLYGGMGLGAACDYNLNSTPTNQKQACGPRFTPSLVAVRNTGIQRTAVYTVGDIRWYPTENNRVDLVATTAGIVHVWEIQRDLIFRIQAQGMRSQEYSGFSANLLPTSVYLTKPVNFNEGYGSTSLQKEFGNFFTAVGGSVTGREYENATDNLGNTVDEQYRNGTISTFNTRFGYHVSPIIYTFIEPSLNWQRYTGSHLNSQGYRVVAGVGTDRISLFKARSTVASPPRNLRIPRSAPNRSRLLAASCPGSPPVFSTIPSPSTAPSAPATSTAQVWSPAPSPTPDLG